MVKRILIVISFQVLIWIHVFSQVAKVTYAPFEHYCKKVDMFQNLHEIDSTNIVMIGNSLTEYAGDWSKLLDVKHVINRGIAGDDANGIYYRLCQILPGRPKAIFLMIGINDLSHDLCPRKVVDLAAKVMDKIRHDSPKTKLYIQSILPINESFGVWKTLEGKTNDVPLANELLRNYAITHQSVYIDLFSSFVRHGTNVMRRELTIDGLHLTPFGYKVWAFEIRKYMRNMP